MVHQESLGKISGNANIDIPEDSDRCRIIRNNNEFDNVITSNPAFYRIQVDSDLLYHGTDRIIDQRPSLVLDFIEVIKGLHWVKGKLFSGASLV